MADFKIDGITAAGKEISGVITADTLGAAKKKAQAMAVQKKFKLKGVYDRKTYIYRVQKGTEKPVDGEQKAYTPEEVRQALEKIGYRVQYVRKKITLASPKEAPAVDIISFVRVSADLMRQKLPFNEILQLLINDMDNPLMKDTLKEINADLKQGKDAEVAFRIHCANKG